MIKISKNEKDYLESQGFTFGTNGEGVLHKTVSGTGKRTTYYLTEEPDYQRWDNKTKRFITVKKGALTVLKEYRESLITFTKENKK